MENTEELKGQVSQDQIDKWKAEFKKVWALKVDGRIAYIKSPNRKTLSYASTVGAKEPMKFNEIILNECWLGGDEEIKTDDELFLSASGQLAKIIEVKEAELEKL